jgi:hypothetical protein
MATMRAPAKLTPMNPPTKPAQIRVVRRSPAYWRVTVDNPRSEITLACDMSFASREKAIISQWEVGVGMVADGGPWLGFPDSLAETAPSRYS